MCKSRATQAASWASDELPKESADLRGLHDYDDVRPFHGRRHATRLMATDTMQLNFANGWGVSIEERAEDELPRLAVLRGGREHYANPVGRGGVCYVTEDEVIKLISEVESWKQDQVFPEWEGEE